MSAASRGRKRFLPSVRPGFFRVFSPLPPRLICWVLVGRISPISTTDALEATGQTRQLLTDLLDLEGIDFPSAGKALRVWVFPRRGTRSPWSSKASDILRSCGLASVTRVERGICFDLKWAASCR